MAGPESANNAASAGTFVPLLTLGIPTTATMAMILGALMIHGITPGPLLIAEHPDVFWGVIASMYIGNVMLLVLNLPLIGLWVQLLRVPYSILSPLILLFCVIGVYTNQGSLSTSLRCSSSASSATCAEGRFRVRPAGLRLRPVADRRKRSASRCSCRGGT